MTARALIGIDDTEMPDARRGTAKLARGLSLQLADVGKIRGVVRQQLLVAEGIPYTFRNSAACIMLDLDSRTTLTEVIDHLSNEVLLSG